VIAPGPVNVDLSFSEPAPRSKPRRAAANSPVLLGNANPSEGLSQGYGDQSGPETSPLSFSAPARFETTDGRRRNTGADSGNSPHVQAGAKASVIDPAVNVAPFAASSDGALRKPGPAAADLTGAAPGNTHLVQALRPRLLGSTRP